MNTNIIYSYTQDQAIEDGMLVKVTSDIIFTAGVYSLKGIGFDGGRKDDYLFEKQLIAAIQEQYDLMPEVSTDGGNDKTFFTVNWKHTKFFVAKNETDGLTVMLPEEY